jgi:kinesin family protein 3/17
MDPKDALLLQLKEEKEALEAQLRGATPEQQAADMEAKIREMEAVHEQEKKRLAEESHLAAEERAELMRKMEEQREEIEKEKLAQAQFANRLKELRRFLGKGSDKLKKKTQKNEAEIAAIRTRFEMREARLRELEQDIEAKKARKAQMAKQCTTTQAKLDLANESLKKWHGKYQNWKAKIPELERTIQEDREQLAGEIDSLNRQLELYSMILENFVPQSEVQKLRELAVFDDERGIWELRDLPIRALLSKVLSVERPNSAVGARRPTAYARKRTPETHITEEGIMLGLRPAPVEGRIGKPPPVIDVKAKFPDQFRDEEDFTIELPGIPDSDSPIRVVRSSRK